MEQFTDYLFNSTDQARPAALILTAILQARCPRPSDISQEMPGNPRATSKALQRVLAPRTSEGQDSDMRC